MLIDQITNVYAQTLEAAMGKVTAQFEHLGETNVVASPIGYGEFVVKTDKIARAFNWVMR